MPTPTPLEAEIHKTRLVCAKRLQSSYVSLLEMFDCVLTQDLKLDHPYDLKEPELADFSGQTKIFSLGAIGNSARLSSTGYAYRLVNKGHLSNNVKFKWPKLNNDQDYFWKYFWSLSHDGHEWLQLKDYADDNYPVSTVHNWFSITWWTDFPLFSDIMLGAYTIGLFSESIRDQVILLRAEISDIESLKVAHVPTVVDAFMQPVFQPVSESPPPDAGVTIDLSSYKSPGKGVNEFVFKPISVNWIEFKPIDIDLNSRSKYTKISKDDPDVLSSLLSYYGTL